MLIDVLRIITGGGDGMTHSPCQLWPAPGHLIILLNGSLVDVPVSLRAPFYHLTAIQNPGRIGGINQYLRPHPIGPEHHQNHPARRAI